jgi:hypothetical protein
MENNFYFRGRFFEDERDFLEYIDRWHETFLCEESLTQMLDLFKKSILLILQFGWEIKNGDMNRILENAFFQAMKVRENLIRCQEHEQESK